jgi:hypothetical protein
VRFYRVSLRCDEHEGYAWYTNLHDVGRKVAQFWRGRKDAEPETNVEVFNIRPTKREILRLLNRVADHPDNG